MKISWSDKITKDYRVYLEPILATACLHQSKKCGLRTMSKYIRRAVIRSLKDDGYPLDIVSSKFSKINFLDKGISY
jgi:hypothetical protein